MMKLRMAAPINLGPEVSVQIGDIDEDGDWVGIVAGFKFDGVWYNLLWLTDGGSSTTDGNKAKDLSEIMDCELDTFIQEVKELTERNGCRFDASHVSTLKDEFHEMKNTS